MRFISTPSSLRCRRGRGPRFSAARPLNRTLTKLSDRLSAVLFKMNESPRRVGPIQLDWRNCRITRRTAARLRSLWRVASRSSRARYCEMELSSDWPETRQPTRQQAESSSQKERRLKGGSRRRRGFWCMRPTAGQIQITAIGSIIEPVAPRIFRGSATNRNSQTPSRASSSRYRLSMM